MLVSKETVNEMDVFRFFLRRMSFILFFLFVGYGVLASIFPYFLKFPLIAGKSDVFRHVLISFGVLVFFHYSFPYVKLWPVFAFVSLFAFLLEVVQPFLTNNARDFQWHDVVSNIVGFGSALLVLMVKTSVLKKRDTLK